VAVVVAVRPTRSSQRHNAFPPGAVRVIWNDEPGEFDPFAASRGDLIARGVYEVTVRFGADAAEAEALMEKLDNHEYLDALEGIEYRLIVRSRGNAVISARVPTDEQPTRDLEVVLDRAERCLTAT
jgi:hypothetical protein